MSAFETLMWRGEVDPRLRSTGTIVEVLDSAPDWARLVEAHERATELVPRLRERVVEPTLPIAPPAWSFDDKFDLHYHLRRVALPAPGTFRQLLDAACSFGQTPLDRARPQWESMLVDGLEGGRSAYVLKFHHSLADGYGLIQLLSMTHGDSREPRPTPERFDATRERQSEMAGVSLSTKRVERWSRSRNISPSTPVRRSCPARCRTSKPAPSDRPGGAGIRRDRLPVEHPPARRVARGELSGRGPARHSYQPPTAGYDIEHRPGSFYRSATPAHAGSRRYRRNVSHGYAHASSDVTRDICSE